MGAARQPPKHTSDRVSLKKQASPLPVPAKMGVGKGNDWSEKKTKYK
jgi:hypothetical protein